jgi:class 3 adenylate cyclase
LQRFMAAATTLCASWLRRPLSRWVIDRSENLDLAARIGVNTGPVVVGTIGDNLRMDYTAIGDTTNLAARLQQHAEPGTILISEATHRVTRDDVRARQKAKTKGIRRTRRRV